MGGVQTAGHCQGCLVRTCVLGVTKISGGQETLAGSRSGNPVENGQRWRRDAPETGQHCASKDPAATEKRICLKPFATASGHSNLRAGSLVQMLRLFLASALTAVACPCNAGPGSDPLSLTRVRYLASCMEALLQCTKARAFLVGSRQCPSHPHLVCLWHLGEGVGFALKPAVQRRGTVIKPIPPPYVIMCVTSHSAFPPVEANPTAAHKSLCC